MTLRFDQPWFFLGLLLCVPMAWAALRCFVGMTGARRWSAILLRVVLVGVLLAMLAGVSIIRTTDRVAVIACVDRSGSIEQFYRAGEKAPGAVGPAYPQAVRDFLKSAEKSRKPEDLAGVVLFGAFAAASGMLEPSPFLIPDDWNGNADGTNIERALRLAGAMIPPDAAGRIVLFSDGVQTAGDGLRAARSLGATNGGGGRKGSIPVDVVPLVYSVQREVVMESLDTPPTVQAGATIPVRVVLSATERATGTLDLQREDISVDINGDAPGTSLRLTLEPGRNVEIFKVPLPEGRIHRFKAIWTPDPGAAGADTVASNNIAEAVTVSPGPGSVLIVDGVSNGEPAGAGSTLAAALTQAHMQVESIGPDSLKPDMLWLQQFDLIILQNVAADAMPRETHSALAACVTQLGAGLVMIGGPESFGPGGWKGSEIEPLLPVKLDLPEKLVTPAAAVIMVIDNSGSMNRPVLGSDRSQQDIADEGAALAIESMDKTDLVGVITFNSDYTVDVPLAPNKNAKATAKLVRSIAADGGTNMPPALEEAHRQIKAAKADLKHVIVLSDGVSMGKEQLPDMVEEMAKDGILVTTIAIGNDADVTMMHDMAVRGKGQFYRVIDPTVLPRVLMKAVRIVRSPLIREGKFTPVVIPSGSPVLDGLAEAMGIAGRSGVAPLNGLVLTQARTEPTVVNVLATPRDASGSSGGEPVLAYWNAGLGRVAAFTSDAQRKWAEPWLDATASGGGKASEGAGYARFWAQLARTIGRAPASTRTQEFTSELEGDRLTVRLRASTDNGAAMDGLIVPGTIYSRSGAKLDVRLSQVAPGEYEAEADLRAVTKDSGDSSGSQAGTYVVVLSPRKVVNGESQALPPVVGGVTRPAPAGLEFKALHSDEALMRSIAEATGGRVLDMKRSDAAGVPDLYSRAGLIPAEGRTPLWPMLAIASVVLMLLDTATRRVAWDRLLSREMGAEVTRGVAAALRDRTVQAAAAVERLRKSPQTEQVSKVVGPDEPSVPVEEPVAAMLTDADAQALREREKARRRQARMAAARGEPTPTAAEAASSDKPEEPDTETGLQAAKRRARKRMEEE
jgi:uncharacterized protein YegL